MLINKWNQFYDVIQKFSWYGTLYEVTKKVPWHGTNFTKRFYVMDLYDVIKSFTWHGTLCFHGKEFYDVTKKGFISCNNMTLQKNVPRHGNYHITKKTICHWTLRLYKKCCMTDVELYDVTKKLPQPGTLWRCKKISMTWDSMTLGKRFHDMELYDDIKKDSIAENAAFYDMQIRTSKVTKPQIYKYKALKLLKMQNYNNTSNTY